MPVRIQRKRTKGWKAPDGAVYVGRPTRYGNPFVVDGWYMKGDPDPQRIVKLIFTRAYEGHEDARYTRLNNRAACVDWFRWFIGQCGKNSSYLEMIKELRGKDLMCWCPLDQPCHADVLLEIANAPQEKEARCKAK